VTKELQVPCDHSILTTLDRTIRRGRVERAGAAWEYRSLQYAPGEAHVVRTDLTSRRTSSVGRSLGYIAHLTDIQLLDVQSPARLEAVHALGDRSDVQPLLPMWRPQELFAAHATDALVRALNAARVSSLTGATLDVALTTGDNIDNMQWNETQAYLRLLSGGTVSMDSGGAAYEGVQDGAVEWAWDPERADTSWALAHGFPAVPGLVEAGLRPFTADGFTTPWLTCYGNHDGLVQGRTRITPELAKIMIGDRKVYGFPPGDLGDFVENPLHVFSGPARAVDASDDRRPVERPEFVRAHFDTGGRPDGHGFTKKNLDSGTAYYVYDAIAGIRIIVLDTTNPAGHYEGSIDEHQLAWLEARLAEVHGGADHRLVVIASHHPRTSMTNARARPSGSWDAGRRVQGDEVAAVLERFPNVVAWISGHTHRHHIRPWQHARGGFWEITTGSVMEWPGQARLLEIIENDDATLSLVSTVVDHCAPVRPGAIDTPDGLAAWHRELAANSPYSVGGLDAGGTPLDRNAELVIDDPRARAGRQ
jgi:metallophosphoesterase (TIGR03767 family)